MWFKLRKKKQVVAKYKPTTLPQELEDHKDKEILHKAFVVIRKMKNDFVVKCSLEESELLMLNIKDGFTINIKYGDGYIDGSYNGAYCTINIIIADMCIVEWTPKNWSSAYRILKDVINTLKNKTNTLYEAKLAEQKESFLKLKI